MQKTENIYMQDNNRRMQKSSTTCFRDRRKLNSVELQDKGRKCCRKASTRNFRAADMGSIVADIEKSDMSPRKGGEKGRVLNDYAIRSERLLRSVSC